MVNKIKSAIGGLAMLAATAMGDSANAPLITVFQYVSPDTTNTNGSYRIAGTIYAGDTNIYDIVKSSDLTNSNSWTVSSLNTNIIADASFGALGVNTPFSRIEPKTSATNEFYKLKSRGN